MSNHSNVSASKVLTAKSSKNHTTGGLTQIQNLSDLDKTLIYHVSPIQFLLGMGIVGSRFCFYGSVLSRFPKRFINDISWIRNYAMECLAELA